ncbi:MAG: substrate-binding domain-containing protein, partial [Chloroflexota bacterium]
ISGAASGSAYLTAATGAFVGAYPSVTLNQTIDGQPDAFTKLCSGSADLIDSFRELSAEAQTNCETNRVTPEVFDLGAQAVVLLGSGDFLTCLTTAEITSVWSAASEKSIINWNQVNSAFPDLPITLVAPAVGDPYGDLLMAQASGQNLPTREDFAETKPNATYRATAAGNLDGAMTYLSWQDYQALSAELQASAQPVGVDAGSGCVTPSAETFSDGSYALARPVMLIVSLRSMARQEVQSLLWFIASDANYTLLADNGVLGLDFSDLSTLRDRLQLLFVQAAEEAAQPLVEATPEATSEAGADATVEAATAASEPTIEVSATEAVPAATAMATDEPAAAPTSEATAEATPAS